MSLSDFTILSKIGEGAFSSVHKVKRISDGNIYALKKVKISNLKEKEKENSLNEVRILASITSPNIIGYKQAFFDVMSNTLCIVMEYAEGGDLEKTITKKKKSLSWVPEEQIWVMAKQVLSGLQVLHDMNIIHRDIKCANIFISEGGYKLGDLNVSKLLKTNLAYTQTGTPYYASPEVWDDKPYELKSDIWSLGCIIYEYCSLRPPFTANSMEGLYKKVLKGVYPRIPHTYSDQLQKFIKKCLQLDPKNRPTCRDLLAIIPSGKTQTEQSKKEQTTSVNLLNTIRVPRHMNSWRDELPKSNYPQKIQLQVGQQTKKNRFGHLSQQKLREIVRQKNPQSNAYPQQASKKNSVKKSQLDIVNSALDHRSPPQQNFHLAQSNSPVPIQARNAVKKIEKTEQLPRIKVHSEPNDIQNLQLLAKMRQEERNKKYNYNRPVWWG